MEDKKELKIDPGTDVDSVLRSLGSFGKYQKIQLSLLILFVLENSFHLVSIVYIAYRPEFRCKGINATFYNINTHPQFRNVSHLSTEYGKCKIEFSGNASGSSFSYSETCLNGFNYTIPKDRTTVTEWDLVCDGAERSEFGQTLIMLGQAMGAVLFSPLADKIGRKPSNMLARVLYFLTALATVFSPNINAFLAFRFLQGTFQGGSVMTSTILYTEIMPMELRHRSGGLNLVGWTTGLVLTSVIGYLCRDISWRYMQLILALITSHALFDWLFYDESIRWLVANGKTEKLNIILKKAAKLNNVSIEKVKQNVKFTKMSNGSMNNDSTTEIKTPVTKYNVLTILKSKQLLCTSFILWTAWITNTLTYYGLMLTTSKLSGNRYLNNIIASLAEFPVVIVQQLLINRIGRKWMLIVFHAIAGVSMVIAMLCSTYGVSPKPIDIPDTDGRLPVVGTVFSLIGRFAITGSFTTVFLYTSEIYPTNIRNTGLGMASTISRLGSMLSPFAMTLSDYVEWGPAAIFAVLNLFVTVSLCPMPETMDRELPTTLSELKLWYKENRGCNIVKKKDKHNIESCKYPNNDPSIIGRKWMLIIFYALAGVSMVIAMLCSTYGDNDDRLPVVGTVFSLIGRFAITGSFSTVFLYTSEIYPTNIRNTGLGMASTISRLGSMLSPFAMTLSDYVEWGPAAIFAVMNMFVTVSLCPMPETMNRLLPTTLSELKLWYKDNKGCNLRRGDNYKLNRQDTSTINRPCK